MQNDPEPAVFAAIAAGDRAAYAAVLHWSAAKLRAYFGRMVFPGSTLEVEDLVQDCLLAIHAKWHTYDAVRPYGPWLRAVARHKLTDALRRRRLFVSLEAIENVLAVPERPDGSGLLVFLDSLPPAQREAVRLTKVDEMTVAQAALRMNRSEGAVKVLVHRGLAVLRQKVRAE